MLYILFYSQAAEAARKAQLDREVKFYILLVAVFYAVEKAAQHMLSNFKRK